ncbi:DUF4433 domain-containing protein [Rosistilla oblonga]|uniref:type II toxin-antitoxin system toxin DNA ADP-ribosyl transferase DarT n=1 Tax=Rosistilla oblonga TaxID=2527990 RepID=UPI003A97A2DA
MNQVPAKPKIYHITHLDNLPKIVEAGCLWSDQKRIDLGIITTLVGMSKIKLRRLREIEVCCHPGSMVGQYVPFYYCPRSIMLYILHRSNHDDIEYRDGQDPIVHLQFDLSTCLDWADQNEVTWALSTGNAGALFADYFFAQRSDFQRIDWSAVGNRDFRSRQVKDGKQAEFLVRDAIPWSLVEHVGVFDQNACKLANQTVAASEHQPTIRIENSWYF